MAKHVILESYAFTPSTRTVVITGKHIRSEQLLLITNTKTGNVIYNFSDPSLGATSHTTTMVSTTGTPVETTTIILAYNTAAMNSTDTLSILVEETYTEIIPSEVMRDPVDKLRVSNPQSLIDTDFEYGVQSTKWESIALLNNRPCAFVDYSQPITGTASSPSFVSVTNVLSGGSYTISNITASGTTVTVSINNTTAIVPGNPVFVQNSLDLAYADGWWIVESVSASTNFTFKVTTAPATALFDQYKTYIYMGNFYQRSAIPAATNAIVISAGYATITTTEAHGLRAGNAIYITNTSGVTGLNSSYIVFSTEAANIFKVATGLTGVVTATLNNSIFPRQLGYIEHRPFDGGVQFSNNSPYHGYQVIRQTRRYFRYQSGKGIQFSTGTILKPAFSVDLITASGNIVTVDTKYPHSVLPGAYITVSGANETGYNGTFLVATVANPSRLTYTATITPSAATATGFPLNVSPASWYGASNRVGMFDFQNGFYFEYDGQTPYVVRRSSTTQISGKIAVTISSATVTGTGTLFSSQLKPGDWIVIRGQSYVIEVISSDTSMQIYPEYRGVTSIACIASKTINTRFAQSQWNIDKCDGTGASKFTLDLSKMQMLYIDYTWYGAGAIRFGFKNNRGEVIYCHRIPNNNVNNEAYMRSGNLPARYETNTTPQYTYLTATLTSGFTVSISVADNTTFPTAGTVAVYAAAYNGAIEYISYTGKSGTTLLTGLTRNVTGGVTTATTFTVTGATTANPGGTAPVQVELYSPQCASVISHWGSSVIMDGKFDDDKAFVFNFGPVAEFITNVAATRFPLLSIRLAPTVDNGVTGLLGVRELINRMQLTLRGIDCFTSGTAFKIELFLNGRLTAGTWGPVGGSSLAQVITHAQADRISGGENIYGFFTNSSSATSQDLNLVRDIGNSILGGGTTLTASATPTNLYPDGPDVITVCATPITGVNGRINTRISWTEAQA